VRISLHKKEKKYIFFFGRILLLLSSLYVVFRIIDVQTVLQHLRNIPLHILAILVVLGIFHTWLTGFRWKLVNPDVSDQITKWQYFKLLMMAKPFNLILPGALGGDVAKTALTLKSVKSNRIDNVIAIIVDRYVGLLSITILGSFALLFMSYIPDKRAFYGLFGLLVTAFVLSLLSVINQSLLRLLQSVFQRLGSFGKKLIHVLDAWQEALLFFKRNSNCLLKALLICFPIHCISFLSAFILANNLGIRVSFFDIALILSLVWVITAIPITISGTGVRELSLIYFLSLYGVKSEPATALSLSLYIVTIALGLIGLLFFLFRESSTVTGTNDR